MLASRNRRREALEEARQALHLDPDTALAHYVVSICLADQRTEAIAAAERAIELDPLIVGAHAQLAYLHLVDSRRPAAEAALRAAEGGLEANPLDAPCRVLRALALERLGRHEEAEAAYADALELGPEAAHVHWAYGEFLLRRGRLSRAVAVLQEADRLEPGSGLRRSFIGMILRVRRAGDWLIRTVIRMHLAHPAADQLAGMAPEAPRVNWVAGIMLALVVLACTGGMLDRLGDRSALVFFLAAAILTMGGLAVARRCEGGLRLAIEFVSGLLGLIWLEVTALMFLSPPRLSASVQVGVSRLHIGASFGVVRVVGIVAVAGMLVFLILALALHRMAQRGRAGDSGRIA